MVLEPRHVVVRNPDSGISFCGGSKTLEYHMHQAFIVQPDRDESHIRFGCLME